MNKTEYEREKELIKLKKDLVAFRKKCELDVIETQKEISKFQHDLKLEEIRIKSAEIKRTRGLIK